MRTRRDDCPPYVTKDGSVIRELMHPAVHGPGAGGTADKGESSGEGVAADVRPVGPTRQSLAEATVPPGGETALHWHVETEEFYHILQGAGWMRLGAGPGAGLEGGPRSGSGAASGDGSGAGWFEVVAGDTICIPPGTPHALRNPGPESLRLLCCCSPAYRHEDTVMG